MGSKGSIGGADAFLAACKQRRTIYALENSSPIPDDKIIDIVNQTVLHTPSSFNSQSTRVLVLLGPEHQYLWGEIAKPTLKAVAPADVWPSTEKKLDGFRAAYGTILFYENPQDVAALQKQFPLYSDKFPQWSEHTNAMHTYVLWTALEQEGFGANLQHYNPLIDGKLVERYGIPGDWQLKGQLVFGKPAGPPNEKTFKPLEERVFVHGAKDSKI